MLRGIRNVALGLLGLVAAGRGPAFAEEPAAGPVEWVKTEVFFGANRPDGRKISAADWADFMDGVMTPRFPAGLTVYEAYGQMQRADGRIEKQASWVVVILHPKNPGIDRSVGEVTDAFRGRFKAQVVIVSTPILSARFYAD